MTEGRHQRSRVFVDSESTQADAELNHEMDEYLDLYDDDEQIDGSKQLPAKGGRHARRRGSNGDDD